MKVKCSGILSYTVCTFLYFLRLTFFGFFSWGETVAMVCNWYVILLILLFFLLLFFADLVFYILFNNYPYIINMEQTSQFQNACVYVQAHPVLAPLGSIPASLQWWRMRTSTRGSLTTSMTHSVALDLNSHRWELE